MTSPATGIPGYVAGTWDIDPVHSHIGFMARHMVVSKVRGHFEKFAGQIVTAGSAVQVFYNPVKQPMPVPDVTNKALAEAKRRSHSEDLESEPTHEEGGTSRGKARASGREEGG